MATTFMPEAQGQRTHSARTKIVATYVYASSQGQRTHSARTNYPHRRERKFNLLTLTLATVTKFPEGVVIGFQICALAPK